MLDLDGTLTDPAPGIGRCIAHALQALQLPIPDDDALRRWIGPPLQHSFRRYLLECGSDADPDAALRLYRERYTETGLYENAVYPGVPEVLEALVDKGVRLLVATSKPSLYAERIVDHFGLRCWLDNVYGSELDGTRVDKVDLLQYIIGRERLDVRHCTMVGDREHDIMAARFHGMTAAGVLWGFGDESELHAAGAHYLLCEPRQLLDMMAG